VHGLLPANFTRRTLSLTASVAVAAAIPAAATAALLVLAAPAQARPAYPARPALASGVSVTIDSMSPRYAVAGSTVSVTGTVSNGTTQPQAGLQVQLLTSPTPFLGRDQMDGYLSQGDDSGLAAAGAPFTLTGSLAPETTVYWHASFNVTTAGIGTFGVYPVAAQVSDPTGSMLASDQTLLPFWPGQQAAGLLRPLAIAWIWPLIDQPHHEVCPTSGPNDLLTSNDLSASLGRTGRLSALLAAGQANAAADLTWVIDPALLGDVDTMTHPYQVDSSSDCADVSGEPASKAAAAWLAALRKVTSRQATVITPYADVDVAALVHSGLNADLTSAYSTGYAVAQQVLQRPFGPSIAVPAGGTADLSVLTTLATAEHIGTVVLDSSEMPPSDTPVFEPDNAVTSIRTPAGTTMNVLLADPVLTSVLQAGDTGSGVLAPGTQFAVSQRFLAETAMIAAEAPDSARSIVVSPPQAWSPSAALAGELLGETAHTPWLAATALGSLARAPDTYASMARVPPPSNRKSPGELSRGYLSTVGAVDAALGVYTSMLSHPAGSYLQSLDEERAATESSAWRGSGAAPGLALAGSLSSYLTGQEKGVKIIVSTQVPMGGASGLVPVSIQNGGDKAIEVQLNASADNSPDRASQLTFGHFQSLVTVQPGLAALVRLPVRSAPIGSTVIQLSLTSKDGTPLGFADASFTVVSTRYGRAILFLIGAAIGVLVLTSVYRAVRRWLTAGDRVTAADDDPAGTVVTETSGARHPTEAPDDLAEARRRADDA
jgi:hypothetical protein